MTPAWLEVLSPNHLCAAPRVRFALLRLWCRYRHEGEFLRPAIVGGLKCSACGAGFVDLEDAGVLLLDDHTRQLGVQAQATIERLAREQRDRIASEKNIHPFEAVTFRVVRGGRVVPAPDYDHVPGTRVEGGEVVRFGRLA